MGAKHAAADRQEPEVVGAIRRVCTSRSEVERQDAWAAATRSLAEAGGTVRGLSARWGVGEVELVMWLSYLGVGA